MADRDQLGAERRARDGVRITDALLRMPELARARSVLSYCSIRSEFDTARFNAWVLASERHLALPRIDRSQQRLRVHEVASLEDDLVPGVWGIREPNPARCREITLAETDFVLVPGAAFDRRGGRLGYGAGFYDRLLAAAVPDLPCVAAAFSVQCVERVPMDEHDRKMTALVTEIETIAFL
ncbi:MAG: 5-formyltetrahydrofolate cyclo-ligase [Betaproteobacteria bacterium]